tara:strand:+ start:5450 stop:9127 length:3678 start_codon:yes stop_codon:yes gene_type:complete
MFHNSSGDKFSNKPTSEKIEAAFGDPVDQDESGEDSEFSSDPFGTGNAAATEEGGTTNNQQIYSNQAPDEEVKSALDLIGSKEYFDSLQDGAGTSAGVRNQELAPGLSGQEVEKTSWAKTAMEKNEDLFVDPKTDGRYLSDFLAELVKRKKHEFADNSLIKQPTVGKTKTIVDNNSYALVPRDPSDFRKYDPNLKKSVQGNVSLSAFAGKDLLRIALGRNWDFSFLSAGHSEQVFGMNWRPPSLFQDEQVDLESCGPPKMVNIEGALQDDLGSLATEEKIVVSCDMPPKGNAFGGLADAEAKWVRFTKFGVTNDLASCPPIINSTQVFYDHYHEGQNPFNPEEQQTKVVPANAQVYNHTNYYNERIDSSEYESILSSRTQLHNCLPSIYGLASFVTRLGTNPASILTYQQSIEKFLSFYYVQTQSYLQSALNALGPTKQSQTAFDTNIIYKRPFEVLFSLYGSMGTQQYDPLQTSVLNLGYDNPLAVTTNIVQRIIDSKRKSATSYYGDVDSFFETYFNEYAYRITQDSQLNQPFGDNTKMALLEKSFTNIIFDPGVETKLDFLIDLYKDRFPFYTEISFTTANFSDLGQKIHDLNLNNLFIYHLAESNSQFRVNRFRENTTLLGLLDVLFPPVYVPPANIEAMTSALLPESDEPETSSIFAGLLAETVEDTEASVENQVDTGVDIPAESTLYDKSSIAPFVDYNYEALVSINNDGTTTTETTQVPVENEKRITDIFEMLNNYVESGIENYFVDFDSDTFDIRNFVSHMRASFDTPAQKQGEFGENLNDFLAKTAGVILRNELFSIYQTNKRSWLDIMEGKPAYTENLFYRIEKSLVTEASDRQVIQNIFIPNRNKTPDAIIKFVDTQVKYHTDMKYKYRVFVHRAVFGAKYYYRWFTGSDEGEAFLSNQGPYPRVGAATTTDEQLEQLQEDGTRLAGLNFYNPTTPDGTSAADMPGEEDGMLDASKFNHYEQFSAVFKAIVEPSVKIVDDLLFETPEILIMDKPPVPPFVDLVPYRAVNNRIKILFDGLVDRFRAEPIVLLESDEEQFANAAKSQFAYDGKIEFGSDDPISTFQIFRTEKHPEVYADFEFYQAVNAKVFEETIQPNKKYFYIFRAVDPHGHVSNPTAIYEVELIDEAGAVKPKIRTVDFKKPDLTDDVKDVKKYIMIRPSLKQLYNSQNPEVDSIFSSGLNKKRKKYKLRLTSKMTGKKIDVNLSFEKKIKNGA